MGDQATFNNPAANAPDAAAYEKGKGKAIDPQDLSMDEDESSDSEPEQVPADDDEEDGGEGLEPISSENIIAGGRRTRGKTIDYAEANEKYEAMEDDDDDDEDYEGNNNEDDGDDQMRD